MHALVRKSSFSKAQGLHKTGPRTIIYKLVNARYNEFPGSHALNTLVVARVLRRIIHSKVTGLIRKELHRNGTA